MPTGGPVSSCRTSTRAPGIVRVQRRLQRVDQVLGVVLVVDLDDDLRVVGLLHARARPRTRSAGRRRRRTWSATSGPRRGWLGSSECVLGVLVGDAADRRLDLARPRGSSPASGASSGSQTSTYERYGRSFGKNCVFSWLMNTPPSARKTSEPREKRPAVIDRRARRRGSRRRQTRSCAAPRWTAPLAGAAGSSRAAE